MEDGLIRLYLILFVTFSALGLYTFLCWYFVDYRNRKPIELTGTVYNQWEHNGYGDKISYYNTDYWSKGKIYGFMENPWLLVGDEIRWKVYDTEKKKRILRLKVINVEYKSDPKDLFEAQVSKIGYLEE